MNTILTISIIANWIFLGLFICWKRDWYDNYHYYKETFIPILSTIILSPIALIIAFFKEFIFGEWDNQ